MRANVSKQSFQSAGSFEGDYEHLIQHAEGVLISFQLTPDDAATIVTDAYMRLHEQAYNVNAYTNEIQKKAFGIFKRLGQDENKAVSLDAGKSLKSFEQNLDSCEVRICLTCAKEKHITAFIYYGKNKPSGNCKECSQAKSRQRYKEKIGWAPSLAILSDAFIIRCLLKCKKHKNTPKLFFTAHPEIIKEHREKLLQKRLIIGISRRTVEEMRDSYLIYQLLRMKGNDYTEDYLLANPHIIESYRQQVKAKRERNEERRLKAYGELLDVRCDERALEIAKARKEARQRSSKKKWEKQKALLSDLYILKTLSANSKIIYKANPELIEKKRKELLAERENPELAVQKRQEKALAAAERKKARKREKAKRQQARYRLELTDRYILSTVGKRTAEYKANPELIEKKRQEIRARRARAENSSVIPMPAITTSPILKTA